MSDVKEKFDNFVKQESQGANLVGNIVVFLLVFFSDYSEKGLIASVLDAALWTVMTAAFFHFVVWPYIVPFFKNLFKS